jgi:serine/threonine protein kinase
MTLPSSPCYQKSSIALHVHSDPQFLAPEYHTKSTSNQFPVDKSMDIWSIGVIFHYLLTGRHLVFEESKKNDWYSVIEKSVPLSHFPQGVEALLLKSLRIVPNERYTIEEMIASNWLNSE